MDYGLTDEERDILERFERGEMRSIPDAQREMAVAREAARNTPDEIGRTEAAVQQTVAGRVPHVR